MPESHSVLYLCYPAMPLPNIVVTGTPGTGKTTFSQLLLETLPEGFQHVNIGDVVKREKAYSGWNDEWDCWDVDEDKVSELDAAGRASRLVELAAQPTSPG